MLHKMKKLPWKSNKCLKDKERHRGKFSPADDDLLRALVVKYGEDWEAVCTEMPGRNPRQVRDRWRTYVDPNINNSPFTRDEDELLEEKYEIFGPKWVKISEFFHNRTDSAVKYRWQYLDRRHRRGKPIIYDDEAVLESSPSNYEVESPVSADCHVEPTANVEKEDKLKTLDNWFREMFSFADDDSLTRYFSDFNLSTMDNF